MNEVLRTEQKYMVNIAEAQRYANYFANLLPEDTNSTAEGYMVRSLYFDTLQNSDYCEKVDGLEIRRKLRLRIYSPHDKDVKLELKEKSGINQRKRSLSLTRQDAIQLISGDSQVLKNYNDDFAMECYSLIQTRIYRPRIIVEYNRRAFAVKANNTRVTFDKNIKACHGSCDLFSETLPYVPAISPFLVTMEVKYNGFLFSNIQQIIDRANKSSLSTGKYSNSFEKFNFNFI